MGDRASGRRRWALLAAAAAGALVMYIYTHLLRGAACGAATPPMTTAELQQKGLLHTRVRVDAFIARHIKGGDFWEVLLVKRADGPHARVWRLPGGYVSWMEDPIAAVVRGVKEETHLVIDMKKPPEFAALRGSPKRDPGAYSLSASYVAKVEEASLKQLPSDGDGGRVRWFPFRQAVHGTFLQVMSDQGDIVRACGKWFEEQGRGKGLYAEVDSGA